MYIITEDPPWNQYSHYSTIEVNFFHREEIGPTGKVLEIDSLRCPIERFGQTGD